MLKKSFVSICIIFLCSFVGIVFNSLAACRMSIIVLTVVCIYRGIQEKQLLNPYFLFVLTPISLMIYVNLSNNYMVDLTTSTWILAIINMGAFLIAFELTGVYKKLDRCIGFSSDKALILNTYILLFLGFSPSLFQMFLGKMMPLASVFSLFSTPAVVCAMKSKNKKVIVSVLATFAFSWIGYVSKSSVLSLIIAVLISYEKYFAITKKQKKKLLMFSILSVIVMIAAFSFANQDRGSSTAREVVAYYSKYGGITWDKHDALLMPYLYLTTPWANLQYVTETQSGLTYGLWLLKPILGYLQIDKIFGHLYELKAYSNFNTFTYIAYCFKDFGYWGSIISSMFLGFFSKKVYSRYQISRSPLDVACYVLVGQSIFQMFFSNEFYTQSFPFTIVIIMGIYKKIFCKQYNIELE